MNYLDVHTHHSRASRRSKEIISLDIRKALEIGYIAQGPFTLGVHPWYIDEIVIDEAYQIIEEATENEYFMSMGELGLDRIIKVPMHRQEEVFTKQVEIAKDKNVSSLVLHCVRAYPDVLNIIKKTNYKGSLIFHDYNGNPDITTQLLKFNSYFCFGEKLFDEKSGGYRSFKHIPNDRILLESDDMEERRIEDVYQMASKLLNIDINKLDLLIMQNAEAAFSKALPPPCDA